MKTLQELDVNYIDGASNPWIPFTPLSDQVFLKYWKIDPVGSAARSGDSFGYAA